MHSLREYLRLAFSFPYSLAAQSHFQSAQPVLRSCAGASRFTLTNNGTHAHVNLHYSSIPSANAKSPLNFQLLSNSAPAFNDFSSRYEQYYQQHEYNQQNHQQSHSYYTPKELTHTDAYLYSVYPAVSTSCSNSGEFEESKKSEYEVDAFVAAIKTRYSGLEQNNEFSDGEDENSRSFSIASGTTSFSQDDDSVASISRPIAESEMDEDNYVQALESILDASSSKAPKRSPVGPGVRKNLKDLCGNNFMSISHDVNGLVDREQTDNDAATSVQLSYFQSVMLQLQLWQALCLLENGNQIFFQKSDVDLLSNAKNARKINEDHIYVKESDRSSGGSSLALFDLEKTDSESSDTFGFEKLIPTRDESLDRKANLAMEVLQRYLGNDNQQVFVEHSLVELQKLLKESNKDYSLEECIGSGASGQVFKAKTSDGQPVALKFLFPPEDEAEEINTTATEFLNHSDGSVAGSVSSKVSYGENDGESWKAVRDREVDVLKMFPKSRHIVQIYDTWSLKASQKSFETENDLTEVDVLVLELIEAGSLGSLTLKNWISCLSKLADASSNVEVNIINFRICLDILSALQELNHANVLHRDLKPDNILLFFDEKDNLRAKLCDFGLARSLTNNDSQGDTSLSCMDVQSLLSQGLGTFLYSAPEQLHSSNYDESVDIYSFGVILAELFCGPFRTEMQLAKFVQCHSNGQVKRKISVSSSPSEGIRELARRCLSKNPSMRPDVHELYIFFSQLL